MGRPTKPDEVDLFVRLDTAERPTTRQRRVVYDHLRGVDHYPHPTAEELDQTVRLKFLGDFEDACQESP